MAPQKTAEKRYTPNRCHVKKIKLLTNYFAKFPEFPNEKVEVFQICIIVQEDTGRLESRGYWPFGE